MGFDSRGLPVAIGFIWGVPTLSMGISQLNGVQPPRWVSKETGEYLEPLKTPKELADDGLSDTLEGAVVLLVTLMYTAWLVRSIRRS